VKEHGEEFLRHARERYDGPLPRYVEDELRSYLRCGDFARGFVHLECTTCKHDVLVAFSCKNRGLCPSCAGRRMAAQAAHLVDAVVPDVPIRQFVLSFPFELSALAATKPEVLRALSRIHAEALAVHYRAAGKRAGYTDTKKLHAGAISFVHRYGSTLNSHVHFHVAALDGMYAAEGKKLRFVHVPAPTREELLAIVTRVFRRVNTWLRKKGYLRDDASDENVASEPTFEEALVLAAMTRGTLVKLAGDDSESDADTGGEARASRGNGDAVMVQGFNLHAGVTIRQGDDMGRERLFRYGLRPAFAVARFRFLPDGNLAYRIDKAGRGGQAKHRVMTPVECLARISALIPPPRYPLTRFHGVLAPRHKLRRLVVPQRAAKAQRCDPEASLAGPVAGERPDQAISRGETLVPATPVVSAYALSDVTEGAILLGPNVLSVSHMERLRGGLLYAASSHIPWATLLARTFNVDVTACARCGGRLRVRAVVTAPDAARRIHDAVARKNARAPPTLAA